MTEKDYAPLSMACVRGLCDKIYDKRKFAGAEIEKMVKDFSDANNTSQIKRLIRVLGQDLMSSTNPNVKNGALMGLSSVAVGLGKGCVGELGSLIPPILACCGEAESRVRYQAAEALFNVVKMSRGAALAHFGALFDALARLAADPEPQVRHGAELLDRLLKDIVTECKSFETGPFVSLVRERMYGRGSGARQFAVSWVCVLDAVPHTRLAGHLPELLDPLLNMLDDPNPEIRRMCEVQLGEFLRGVRGPPARTQLAAMTNVLIAHAQASDDLVQLTALSWLHQFCRVSGREMLPHASGVLLAALPCLAYTDEPRKNIREVASSVNVQLTKLVELEGSPESVPLAEGEEVARLDLSAVVGVLTQLLHHNSVHTKCAVLEWMLHLYTKLPSEMFAETEQLFGGVVSSLTDTSDEVVRRSLAVLAEICSCRADPSHPPGDLESSPYYYKFLQALLRLLAADESLLEDRGAFIIRQLCVLLRAEDVYRALAAALVAEPELKFASTMVDVLSTILLTAAELYDLRHQLRQFDKPSTHALFVSLYSCWCHSPVALLALCLLTHNYRHCNELIQTFGDLEVTVDFLTEVDKLVQLIESPIFAYLRLELLQGAGAVELRGALFGLLMLLPQTDAFHALRTRLHCVPTLPPSHHQLNAAGASAGAATNTIDFVSLLERFVHVQAQHRQYKLRDRARP